MSGARTPAPGRRPGEPGATPHGLTRRAVLAGVSRTALLAGMVGYGATALVGCGPGRGEPWQDETFWDDGTGWVE